MPKKYKIEKSRKKQNFEIFALKDLGLDLNDSRIELIFNKEITIEGCKKVVEYEKNHIKLRLNKGFLTLVGSDFDIKVYENDLIRIKGKISTLDFCV